MIRLASHQFIAEIINGYNIAKNSFVCESLETMKTILGAMNVSQTAIIYALRNIRSLKPELNIETFQTLIIFDNCTKNDIKELRKINLLDDDFLFEVITTKLIEVMISREKKNKEISILKNDNKKLERKLNLGNVEVSELRSENQELKNENTRWLIKKCIFLNIFNQEEIKKVLKKGRQNGYNYTINQAIALIDNFQF